MENRKNIMNIFLWIARIAGTLVVAFVLFFLLSDILNGKGPGGSPLSLKETITFFFFPLSTILGLLLALKWEGLGGTITIVGLIGLLIIRPDLVTSLLLVSLIAIPGFLYLGYWYFSKNYSSN